MGEGVGTLTQLRSPLTPPSLQILLPPEKQDGVWEAKGQVGADWDEDPGCSEEDPFKAPPRHPEKLPGWVRPQPSI